MDSQRSIFRMIFFFAVMVSSSLTLAEETKKRTVILTDQANADRSILPDGQGSGTESTEAPRKKPTQGIYLGFGPSFFSNLNATGIGYGFAGGISWDVRQFAVLALADLAFEGNAIWTNLGVGGRYYFLPYEVTPVAQAEFGLAFNKTNHVDGLFAGTPRFGFVGGVGAGVQIFRSLTINLDILLKWQILMNSNEFGIPMRTTLTFGLFF